MLSRIAPSLVVAGLLAVSGPPPAQAASPDNNVEWAGVSHIHWQDRRPLCPVDGESFAVRFQAWRDDLTAARVLVTVGATTTPIAAVRTGTKGPYDLWQAQIPATAAASESYLIELTDGTDIDFLGTSGMSEGAPAGSDFVVDFVTLAHAPLGATPVSGGGAVFKVWAPTRTSVYVRGAFNEWGLGNPLTKAGEHFIGRVSGVEDRHQYKYFFNNSHWNTDARARSLNAADGPYNAHVEDPFRFGWQIEDFATPSFDELILYQLHVGTFAGRNDPFGAAPHPNRYVDIAARVDHLAELGINAVMVNPINEFPGDESAGYNPITAWAPEWKYGPPDELKFLVDALHQRGIAVILDVVWNHLSFDDNLLWFYDGSQQYFDTPEAVDTPWGSQADFDQAAVRDYYANSALYWLEEFKVDGFRMDATDFMTVFPQEAAGWSLMQRLNDEVDNRWANKIMIAEQLPDDPGITRPTGSGGAGFDSQYHDAFNDRLREVLFDAAAGDPEMWKVSAIVQGSGAFLNGTFVTNYIQLHDEAWPTSGGERLVKTIDTTFPHDDAFARGRMKLALGMVMLSPGVPAMLMGDEWLEGTPFGTGSSERIDWAKKTTYAPHFAYVKRIIQLRRTLEAFRANRPVHVLHLNESGNVIAFRRTDASGNAFVVVANFGNTDYGAYRIGLPAAGEWSERVNSQSSAYDGNGLDNPGTLASEPIPADGFVQSIAIQLPAMGFVVLGPTALVAAPDAPPRPQGARIERISPIPARERVRVEFTLPESGPVELEVLDVSGRRVARLVAAELPAGRHTTHWNGRDSGGANAQAGVYFVRLRSAHGIETRRLPLLR